MNQKRKTGVDVFFMESPYKMYMDSARIGLKAAIVTLLVIAVGMMAAGVICLIIRSKKKKACLQCHGVVLEHRVRHMKGSAYLQTRYSYEVGGREYTKWAISTSLVRSAETRRRGKLLEKAYEVLPPGASLTVHYEERNPNSSFLESGGFHMATLIVAISLLCVGGSFFMAAGVLCGLESMM